MPKIPPLDKINEPKDVPCIRTGCKANSKARCMSPEGVASPRVHAVRQYLFAYITLGEMPEKPNSVTAEEKLAADKLAQEYLGEIPVDQFPGSNADLTGDDVLAGDASQGSEPETTSAVVTDLQDFITALTGPDASEIIKVADPAQMLATLLAIQKKEAPQDVLDMVGENRLAILEIMNGLNEVELLDLQMDSLRRLHDDKVNEVMSRILILVKAGDTVTS